VVLCGEFDSLLSKCELNATKIIKIIGIINLFPNFVTLIVEQKPLIKMKDLTITSIIKVYTFDELNKTDQVLMTSAMEATTRSYAPYSKFSVGAAALLANGIVVTGTNQENAAYPSGLCAERTTLFYANSQYPDQPVLTLAIAARTEKDFIDLPIPPCGACRQVILETEKRYKQPIRILLYGKKEIYEVKSIGDLLPLSFDASAMKE
jgi:cytidine deaminase